MKFMRQLFLLFFALTLGIASAQNKIVPINGVYDPATGLLTGIVQQGIPGVLPQASFSGATVATLRMTPPPDATTDMTSAIQTLINQASTLGAGLPTGRYYRLDFPNATFGITGLLLQPNVFYNFGTAKFLKLTDGSSVPTNSMLRTVDTQLNGSYYGSYDNIRISGGVFDTNHHTCPAQVLRFENVRDFVADGMTVIHTPECTGWAAQIGGQRVRITNSTILGGTELNQDGWHVTHGDSIILSGLYAASGDDALAVGIDKTSAGAETWDNEGLTNLTVNGFVAASTKATGVKIYYGLDTSTNMPFNGIRGTINNVVVRGLVGVGGLLRNGGVYIVDTTKLTLLTSASGSSLTLNANYTGPTDTGCFLIFDTGAVRGAGFVSGSPTVTLNSSVTAGTAVQQVCPSRIQNIDIDGNLMVGSALNDGSTPFGLFVQGATNVRYRGTMQFTDTPNLTLTFTGAPTTGATSATLNAGYTGPTNTTAAITFSTNNEVHVASVQNGQTAISWTPALLANAGTTATVNGFNACSVNELIGGDIQFSSPAMPHGAGCAFFNSTNINVHDGLTVGAGNSRGVYEATGVNGLRIHDNTAAGISSGAGFFIAQGTGSGLYPNAFTIHHNLATKASGASLTRFYIQTNPAVGNVPYATLTDNDIRGSSNGTSLDQGWNTNIGQSGTEGPDYFYVNGNRGFIPNANGMGYAALTLAASQSIPLLNTVGGHFTIGPVTANTVLQIPTGGVKGMKWSVTWTEDATGGRTLGYAAGYKFYGGTPPASCTANQSLRVDFEMESANVPVSTTPSVCIN